MRYLRDWHNRGETESPKDFVRFLYDSPVDSLEFAYRDATGRLLAVGICDPCPNALSSVYFYFEPSARRRGLGTFGALVEIEWAREREIGYYYLGYHVAGCKAMSYKSAFRPHEFLDTDGVWRESRRA
jgi:arginine-tRNA-protein transferase